LRDSQALKERFFAASEGFKKSPANQHFLHVGPSGALRRRPSRRAFPVRAGGAISIRAQSVGGVLAGPSPGCDGSWEKCGANAAGPGE